MTLSFLMGTCELMERIGDMSEQTLSDAGYQINMVCCTMVICNEIERGIPQRDIALSFAMALKSEAQGADAPDWEKIADAALKRWGPSGWRRLKERGWGIAEGRIDPLKKPTTRRKPSS